MEQTVAEIPIPLDLERLLRDENKQLPVNSEGTNSTAGYYRSRLFHPNSGLNPIISAAQPLLALLPRLVQSPVWPNEVTLKEYLCHEVKAFETHAKANEISDEMLALARIILLSTIDDKLATHARSKHVSWDTTTLQNYFLNETQSGERFFTILKRASDYPSAHLDLLELIYTCLANGYRGIYRHQINGAEQLSLIREQLYELISDKRKNTNTTFFNQPIENIQLASKTWTLPFRRYAILICLTLSALIMGMYYTLDASTSPILQQLNTLLHESTHQSVAATEALL